MKSLRKNQRGFSLVHAVVITVLSLLATVLVSRVFLGSIQLAQRSSVINQMHMVRERVFKNLDCQATLNTQTPPLPASAESSSAGNYCVTTVSEALKSPNLKMIAKDGTDLFKATDSGYVSKEGEWSVRAGCYLKTIKSGTHKKCVMIHRSLTNTPQTGWHIPTDWFRLFEFPLCCDSSDITNGAGISAVSSSSATNSSSTSAPGPSSSSSSSASSTSSAGPLACISMCDSCTTVDGTSLCGMRCCTGTLSDGPCCTANTSPGASACSMICDDCSGSPPVCGTRCCGASPGAGPCCGAGAGPSSSSTSSSSSSSSSGCLVCSNYTGQIVCNQYPPPCNLACGATTCSSCDAQGQCYTNCCATPSSGPCCGSTSP